MDHLTEAQISELQSDLEKARIEEARLLAALDVSSLPVDLKEPIGRLSRMDALQQQGLAQKQKATSATRLAQIDAALKRMQQGTYGICLKTGDPISFARLKVMPEHPIGPVERDEDG